MAKARKKTARSKSNPARNANKAKNASGANLGFEATLWAAADKLRGHMDAAEYKHVVLGLIFLKYISDAFTEVHTRLANEEYADPEDRDEYTAQNVFWVPKPARWPHLRANAKQPTLGRFASAEGKGGGEFYTPQCIVKLLVAMIEPYHGRVYDPCCGSGGMFVQSENFVLAHGGRVFLFLCRRRHARAKRFFLEHAPTVACPCHNRLRTLLDLPRQDLLQFWKRKGRNDQSQPEHEGPLRSPEAYRL